MVTNCNVSLKTDDKDCDPFSTEPAHAESDQGQPPWTSQRKRHRLAPMAETGATMPSEMATDGTHVPSPKAPGGAMPPPKAAAESMPVTVAPADMPPGKASPNAAPQAMPSMAPLEAAGQGQAMPMAPPISPTTVNQTAAAMTAPQVMNPAVGCGGAPMHQAVGMPMQVPGAVHMQPMQQMVVGGMQPVHTIYGMQMQPTRFLQAMPSCGMTAAQVMGQGHVQYQPVQCPVMDGSGTTMQPQTVRPKAHTVQAEGAPSGKVKPSNAGKGVHPPKQMPVEKAPATKPPAPKATTPEHPTTSRDAQAEPACVISDEESKDARFHTGPILKAHGSLKRSFNMVSHASHSEEWSENDWNSQKWHNHGWQWHDGHKFNDWWQAYQPECEEESEETTYDKGWVDKSWETYTEKSTPSESLWNPYLPKGWEMKCAVLTHSYRNKDWSKCDALIKKFLEIHYTNMFVFGDLSTKKNIFCHCMAFALQGS